jgi:DNA-binding MarR family transcriptional regulator
VIVELTDEGGRLVDEAVAAVAESDRQLLARLDADEIAQLQALLKKLLASLEPVD